LELAILQFPSRMTKKRLKVEKGEIDNSGVVTADALLEIILLF
jgi:hypothetical protein